jgi:hypothetical protein
MLSSMPQPSSRQHLLPLLNGFSDRTMNRFHVWVACFVSWNFEKTYTLLFSPVLFSEIPPYTSDSQAPDFVSSQSRK